jgi:predicted O-methyltransferase YrrM
LCIASGLPQEGRLICMDISEEFTSKAMAVWAKAGVAEKIRLVIAPAAETMGRLIAEGGCGAFDFGFIDAEKELNVEYYELAL